MKKPLIFFVSCLFIFVSSASAAVYKWVDEGGVLNFADDYKRLENIRQAILMLVSYWYDNRGSAQFGSRGRSDERGSVTSGIIPSEIPPGVEALLSQNYRARILP